MELVHVPALGNDMVYWSKSMPSYLPSLLS